MDCKKSLEENELLKMSKGQEYQNNSKWTDGQPYERSRRMKHQVQMENEEFSKNMDTSAYSSALHHDENTWDILNQTLSGAGF
jgi:Tfp pilus assembly major pilin PilA